MKVPKSIAVVLFFGLMLWGHLALASEPKLIIDTARPAPNYEPTMDSSDLAQLVDGQKSGFPTWTKRSSVGWQHGAPIVLLGHVEGGPILSSTVRGLAIQTAKGAYAGVFPPSRVDVYCGVDGKNWMHAGALEVDFEAFPDRSNVRLAVPIDGLCSTKIAIVMHPNVAYVMLDEIEIIPREEGGLNSERDTSGPFRTDDLATDSRVRLRAQFKRVQAENLDRFLRSNNFNGNAAWLVAPWQSITNKTITSDQIGQADLNLKGVADWPTTYVVGILNGSEVPRNFTISFAGRASLEPDLFDVEPVTVANGDVVYDALMPRRSRMLALPPRSIAYLMVSHPAQPDVVVKVESSDPQSPWMRVLNVRTTFLDRLPARQGKDPDVFVWSYLSDAPIWSVAKQAKTLGFLRDSGVNVFVVHPASIPVPGTSDWGDKERLLRAELRAYKGGGTVLLELDWNEKLDPGRLTDEDLRPKIESWLDRIINVLNSEGYSFDDWALYPIDEPTGLDYEVLETVGRWIKERASQVRIYANPSSIAPLDLLPGGAVYSLFGLVDIWQPLVGIPADFLGPVVGRQGNRRWWIYQVGKTPAKEMPPNCYRKIAWESERAGASGFGFWSFSDTGGSSAWDDLDGVRPDWAAVYESSSGVVSSRRWESFRQGIREYRVLSACRQLDGSANRTEVEACKRLRAYIESDFLGLACR